MVVGVDGAGRTHALTHDLAGREAIAVDPVDGAERVGAALETARNADAPVLVDDAHRFSGPALAHLAAAVRRGACVRISRRPTITKAELAELDSAVSAIGRLVELPVLSTGEVGALLARTIGRPVDTDRVVQVHASTGGLPALVVALADGGSDAPLRARVARQLAGLPPLATDAAVLLGVTGEARDDTLATALEIDRSALAVALRELREAGLLDEQGVLLPAVATAVAGMLTPAQLRQAHHRLASALPAHGDPVIAALELRSARAHSSTAAMVFAAAGESLRFTDPSASSEWLELALTTGARHSLVAAGLAETALLLGRPAMTDPDVLPVADPASELAGGDVAGARSSQHARLAIAAAVAAAHQGRSHRAADALLAAPHPGPLLAVPALMAIGRTDEARSAASAPGPMVARLLAQGALMLSEPDRALPVLIEAAEAFEAGSGVLVPDTPHAVAAIVASAAGDLTTASHLLDRAVHSGVGGPHAVVRHQLLAAWVHLRGGRLDAARAMVAAHSTDALPGRERLLCAALEVGLARRSGEASTLREVWPQARPALVRRTVDLLSAEPSEEILVAASRLGEGQLVEACLADLDVMAAGLDDPPSWRLLLGWMHLHTAVSVDDAGRARDVAVTMTAIPASTPRQRALRDASRAWADALAGSIDEPAVLACADALAGTGLRWEASRLCGHAGIRTTDAATARRLLERARDLGDLTRTASARTGDRGSLTEREADIARLVLAGQTHKAIGTQLYLSPKTVEHHVARIRGKLGATNRAELMAALRDLDV